MALSGGVVLTGGGGTYFRYLQQNYSVFRFLQDLFGFSSSSRLSSGGEGRQDSSAEQGARSRSASRSGAEDGDDVCGESASSQLLAARGSMCTPSGVGF